MIKRFCHILLGLVFIYITSIPLRAQMPEYYNGIINMDSLIVNCGTPVIFMKQVYVTPGDEFRTKSERKKYSRLLRNFKRVYPYAKLLSGTMQDIETSLQDIPDKRDQKRYIKIREKQFRRYYEKDIRKLTVSQGILLIKLIDRETGETSYDIIKEFKGGVLAGTYQAIARIFGHNLKTEYDPEGEDKEIEMLVLKYENGQL